jgi:cyclophilin family peptidyl-prolyl cis-trans isomerase
MNEGLQGGIWRRNWHATLASVAVLAALAMAGCGSDAGDAPTPTGGAVVASAKASKNLDPLHPEVDIETNLGKIRVRLDATAAPGTVRNFLNYCGEGFYVDTLFHYVNPDKMILAGGYSVDGQPKLAGGTVRNEAHNGLKNTRGTIAMARDVSGGIDSATSQFFINLADAPTFDHRGDEAEEYGYCVFGEVVDGLDVADQISRSPTNDQGGDLAQTPVPPVIIKAITRVK